jgi:N-acyl-D-amino-acid deacylase
MRIFAGVLLAASVVAAQGPPAQPPFDLLVTGGRVINGTGTPAHEADVGIRDGRIAMIGSLAGAAAKATVEARGRIVAPGFIDVHTHADEIAKHPLAEHFVRMGVTTVIAGNCGGSADDVAAAFREIEQTGVALNYATLFGHNTVRRAVMGTERRAPSAAELTKMQALVGQAMKDGAVGFSTGLQYVPGTYADQAEIIALARAASAYGGVYATHMRNEGTALESAIKEALDVGEAAQMAVEISHLKVDAPSRWGASEHALAMIDAARARGMRVAADVYLYDAASSTLGIRFPSWVLEGGQEQINQRLDDIATWTRIQEEMKTLIRERGLEHYGFARIASYRAEPSLNGLSIPDAARKVLGKDDIAAQLEMMRRMLRAGGASMVYQFMSEDDIGRILRHPQVSIASDSGLNVLGEGVPHPRGYGNNARALGRYVRERRVISLEEAIRKMTALPADHFGFRDRGRLAVGQAADIVVFDPGRVTDRASYEQPHQYPDGISTVIVNGVIVLQDASHTQARPGRVLRYQAHQAP